MGRQGKGAPRMTWSQRADKLDGIRRDPKTGIVLARETQHPLANWFHSIPMGQGLPGMQMPAEVRHLLAIHVFDNLRLPVPKDPLYKPRRDRNARRDIAMEAVLWVPVGEPDEEELEDITTVPVAIDDISGYSTEQLAAMKAQIKQEEIRRRLVAGADQPHLHEGDPQ